MQKTKLGISVGLYCSLVYLCSLFAGPLAVVLMIGYACLMEENIWLKKNTVKALVITLGFSALTVLVGLLPDILATISNLGFYFDISFLTTITSTISGVMFLIEEVLTLLLAYKALNQGTIKIGFIDKFIEKHFPSEAENS